MKALDILRGLYAKAPPGMRGSLSRVLALLPTRWVYGRGYFRWRERIARADADPAFAEAFARESLAEILTLAGQAPLHRERVGAVSADPGNAFEMLDRFPMLTKDDLRRHAAEVAVAPLDQLDLVTTSGSSGRPLQVWLDRTRGVREQAFIHAVWARAGFRTGDARLVLRGVQIQDVDRNPIEWEAALRELRCSPFHLTDAHMAAYVAAAKRRRIRYIHGYPSGIAILARYLLRQDDGWRHQVRGVFPISEPLYDEQRSLFAQAFPGAAILPFYGMTEKVAFAETAEDVPAAYRFNPLYGWAELLDDAGARVTQIGQVGRVVGTGFTSRGMPLVRYDTGDEAQLVELPAADNGWRLRVTGLHGRWRPEYLVSGDGALISIAALNVHSKNYLAIREYMFTQDRPGHATLLAVPSEGATRAELDAYLDEVRAKVGQGIVFDMEVLDHLEPAPRGKRRFIRQTIDLKPYLDHD